MHKCVRTRRHAHDTHKRTRTLTHTPHVPLEDTWGFNIPVCDTVIEVPF